MAEEKKAEVKVEKVEKVDKGTIAAVKTRTETDRELPAKEQAVPLKVMPKLVVNSEPKLQQALPAGIYPKSWERLDEMPNVVGSYRLRVPGGWLVLIIPINRNNALSKFISDPEHRWKFE